MTRILFFTATAALVAALPLFAAVAAHPTQDATLRGVEFIRTTQQPDGGFGGFGPGQSLDAILAIRSAGLDPNTFDASGNTPLDFVVDRAADLAANPALAGKAALAARALALDPRDVGGVDFVAAIIAGYDPASGLYAEDAFSHSLAMIGLACGAGMPVPSGAVVALRDAQLGDGGWGFGGSSDADTTGLALQALAAAGIPPTDPAIVRAVEFLRAVQGNDGGWGFDPDDSNANSTALALQGLIAAGEDIHSLAYARSGVTPVAFLLAIQQPDGAFPGFDPAFATNQAVPALAGKTLCDAPNTPARPAPAAAPTPRPPATGTGIDGETPGGSDTSAPVIAGALILLVAATGMALAGQRRSSR